MKKIIFVLKKGENSGKTIGYKSNEHIGNNNLMLFVEKK